MKIAMICYPSYGGSGTIATELGKALGLRGHEVHFISYAIPYRLREYNENVFFHEVSMLKYPLFDYPPYTLALSNKMVEVAETYDIEIFHVHYALPHTISAYLAKQILNGKPKLITTLHGTDVTIVGSDESYYRINKFGMDQNDGITTVSEFLKRETEVKFSPKVPIKVIPNFVDTDKFSPTHRCRAKCLFAPKGERIIMHVSNFRPVKRVEDVISVFSLISAKIPSRLLMIGDGPMMSHALRQVEKLGLCSHVTFMGKQDNVQDLLPIADIFLAPSENESFGLAALEAMSCGVPVIASDVGGHPELIEHGKTGFLAGVGDIKTMADWAIKLLSNEDFRTEIGRNARNSVLERFRQSKVVDLYEEYYEQILSQGEKKPDTCLMESHN